MPIPLLKSTDVQITYWRERAELLLAEPHHFDLNEKIWKIPALHIKQFRRKVILGHEIPDF